MLEFSLQPVINCDCHGCGAIFRRSAGFSPTTAGLRDPRQQTEPMARYRRQPVALPGADGPPPPRIGRDVSAGRRCLQVFAIPQGHAGFRKYSRASKAQNSAGKYLMSLGNHHPIDSPATGGGCCACEILRCDRGKPELVAAVMSEFSVGASRQNYVESAGPAPAWSTSSSQPPGSTGLPDCAGSPPPQALPPDDPMSSGPKMQGSVQ